MVQRDYFTQNFYFLKEQVGYCSHKLECVLSILLVNSKYTLCLIFKATLNISLRFLAFISSPKLREGKLSLIASKLCEYEELQPRILQLEVFLVTHTGEPLYIGNTDYVKTHFSKVKVVTGSQMTLKDEIIDQSFHYKIASLWGSLQQRRGRITFSCGGTYVHWSVVLCCCF